METTHLEILLTQYIYIYIQYLSLVGTVEVGTAAARLTVAAVVVVL